MQRKIIQVITLLGFSLIFESLMRVMSQRELGKVLKVCGWSIAAFWFIEIVDSISVWVVDKLSFLEKMMGG